MKNLILITFLAMSFSIFAQNSQSNLTCSSDKFKKTKSLTGKSQEDQVWLNKYQEMEVEKASALCLLQRINKELSKRNQNPLTYDFQHNFEVMQSNRLAEYQELQDQIDTIEMKEFMLSLKEIEELTQKFKHLKVKLQLDLKQLP